MYRQETSVVLLQSGLDERWWSDSMECYCRKLRNVQVILAVGKTLYETRCGEPFQGPTKTVWSTCGISSDFTRDQASIHQFGKKVLPGILLGFELVAGGIWKGYILIADLEEMEKLEASAIYP